MLRLLFDENVDQDIVRALRRRLPEADTITAQEADLALLANLKTLRAVVLLIDSTRSVA